MKLTGCRNSSNKYNEEKSQKNNKKPKEGFVLHDISVDIYRKRGI